MALALNDNERRIMEIRAKNAGTSAYADQTAQVPAPAPPAPAPVRSSGQIQNDFLRSNNADPRIAKQIHDELSGVARVKRAMVQDAYRRGASRAELEQLRVNADAAERAFLDVHHAITPSALNQTPAERQAASDSLAAQYPAAVANMRAQYDADVARAASGVAGFRRDRAIAGGRQLLDTPGIPYQTPADTAIGFFNDTQRAHTPRLDAALAEPHPYQQQINDVRQRRLDAALQSAIAERNAYNPPATMTFGNGTGELNANQQAQLQSQRESLAYMKPEIQTRIENMRSKLDTEAKARMIEANRMSEGVSATGAAATDADTASTIAKIRAKSAPGFQEAKDAIAANDLISKREQAGAMADVAPELAKNAVSTEILKSRAALSNAQREAAINGAVGDANKNVALDKALVEASPINSEAAAKLFNGLAYFSQNNILSGNAENRANMADFQAAVADLNAMTPEEQAAVSRYVMQRAAENNIKPPNPDTFDTNPWGHFFSIVGNVALDPTFNYTGADAKKDVTFTHNARQIALGLYNRLRSARRTK